MADINPQHKRGYIYSKTLGCKVNAYETALIQKDFYKKGFEVTSDPRLADIYIINTCTVTAEADRKTRQMIRRARKEAPGAIVAAMGCQIQSDPENNEADVIVGTQNRMTIVDKSIEALESRFEHSPINEQWRPKDLSFEHSTCEYEEHDAVLVQDGARAYIKIQDGCDRFCSYCIIPYMRGGSRSREMSSILSEARALSKQGYKEVVITGINICAYGKDLDTSNDLSDVVRCISEISGLSRIRLSSLEPIYLSDDIIEKLSVIDKLAPHFHISLQSGSNDILKFMNRHYDKERFLHIIQKIREKFRRCSFTTDIIVGFPGEDEEHHIESLDFCRKVVFSKIHVFPFSPRKGTQAAKLKQRVSNDIVKKRCSDFLSLSTALFEQQAYERRGEILQVLVESECGSFSMCGYSEDYFRVKIKMTEKMDIGEMVFVRIDGIDKDELTGVIIKN